MAKAKERMDKPQSIELGQLVWACLAKPSYHSIFGQVVASYLQHLQYTPQAEGLRLHLQFLDIGAGLQAP
jgi:hypothetical protein